MFSDRLEALRKERNLTQKRLADIAEVSPVAVKKWLNGEVKNVAAVYITRLADYFHVNSSWLVFGKGPKVCTNAVVSANNQEEDYVQIKESTIGFEYSSGVYRPTWKELETGSVCVYKRSFFIELGVKPENCIRVCVGGDSMSPLIFNGDYVLIDTSLQRDIAEGKIYAIGVEDHLLIRRLFLKTNKGLVIRSDNRNFVDEELSPEEVSQYITIIGRVIERSGSNPFR